MFNLEEISRLAYIKQVTLDLADTSTKKYLTAKQNDINSRFLEIVITEALKPKTIPEGTAVILRGTKPNGNVFLNDGIIANGKIYVDLSSAITHAGRAKCDINLTDVNGSISTVTFYLEIAEQPFDENAVIDSDEFSALTTALVKTEKVVEACKEFAAPISGAVYLRDITDGFYRFNSVYLIQGSAQPTSDNTLIPTPLPDAYWTGLVCVRTEVSHTIGTPMMINTHKSLTLFGETTPNPTYGNAIYENGVYYINYVYGHIADSEEMQNVSFSVSRGVTSSQIEQEYNSKSANAQSGVAVASAIEASVGNINNVLATLVEVEET